MRVRGFVVGYDRKDGELVWTVKANDFRDGAIHEMSGKKFLVYSLHPGTMLSRPAVDVTFEIQPVGKQGELKAVDVSLGKNFPEDSATKENPNDTMSFALVEEKGKIYAWYNECETEDECRAWLEEQSDECHLIAFLQVSAKNFGKSDTLGFNEDSAAVFYGLRTMMKDVDAVNHAISAIVTDAFQLGRKTKQ